MHLYYHKKRLRDDGCGAMRWMDEIQGNWMRGRNKRNLSGYVLDLNNHITNDDIRQGNQVDLAHLFVAKHLLKLLTNLPFPSFSFFFLYSQWRINGARQMTFYCDIFLRLEKQESLFYITKI